MKPAPGYQLLLFKLYLSQLGSGRRLLQREERQ